MARPITTAGQTLVEADPRRKYTDDQVDSALILLSILGSPSKVSEQLAKEWDQAPCEMTVRYWRDHSHADRYLEIRREVVPVIRQRLAARHEDIALAALEKTAAALDRLDVDEIGHGDLGKTIQQLSVSAGIHDDKSSLLRGMPTQVIARMDIEENLDAIARISPSLVVDGTATDVTDAEVVE